MDPTIGAHANGLLPYCIKPTDPVMKFFDKDPRSLGYTELHLTIFNGDHARALRLLEDGVRGSAVGQPDFLATRGIADVFNATMPHEPRAVEGIVYSHEVQYRQHQFERQHGRFRKPESVFGTPFFLCFPQQLGGKLPGMARPSDWRTSKHSLGKIAHKLLEFPTVLRDVLDTRISWLFTSYALTNAAHGILAMVLNIESRYIRLVKRAEPLEANRAREWISLFSAARARYLGGIANRVLDHYTYRMVQAGFQRPMIILRDRAVQVVTTSAPPQERQRGNALQQLQRKIWKEQSEGWEKQLRRRDGKKAGHLLLTLDNAGVNWYWITNKMKSRCWRPTAIRGYGEYAATALRGFLEKSKRKMEVLCQLYTSTLPNLDGKDAVQALLDGKIPRHWIVEKVKVKEVVRPRLFLCPEIRAIFVEHYFDSVKQLLLGTQQGLEHDSPSFLSLLAYETIVGMIAQFLTMEQFYFWKEPHLREADRDKKKRQKRNREKREFEAQQKRRGAKKPRMTEGKHPRVTQEEPIDVGYPHSLLISHRLIT